MVFGDLSCDAMGNIRAIGADTYVYDTAGRLVSGTADVNRTGILSRQDYSYDASATARARHGLQARSTIRVVVSNRIIHRDPSEAGENSSAYLTDTDAVIIGPGQSIDGQTTGAYKIGASTVSIEGSARGKIEISRGVGYVTNAAIGHAGRVDAATAQRNGWVAPVGPKGGADAAKKAQELKEEKQQQAQQKKAEEQRQRQQKDQEHHWWQFWRSS
jgi:hypothetical protein